VAIKTYNIFQIKYLVEAFKEKSDAAFGDGTGIV
jgi:hypothetical protein